MQGNFSAGLRRFCEENPKLVKVKPSVRFPHLSVIKYTKTAFFKGNWNIFLENARGTVVDADYNIVALPFRKIFNYGIDKESPKFSDRDMVYATRKVNGFMLAITLVDGELLISTTGSLDSDFVGYGVDLIMPIRDHGAFFRAFKPGVTYMFEAVHKEDPHIIPEQEGLYYIGERKHDFRAMQTYERDSAAAFYAAGCRHVHTWYCEIAFLKDMARTCDHEGFVFYTKDGQSAKIKTPYYLAAKLFGRGNLNTLLGGKAKNILDEELWPLVDHVKSYSAYFAGLDEQGKIAFVRRFLDEYLYRLEQEEV